MRCLASLVLRRADAVDRALGCLAIHAERTP
jgi:hypothetical protein